MSTIALGLPHTPWVPERVESFKRLRTQLGLESFDHTDLDGPDQVKVFDQRATNKEWPLRMWRWALDTGASHFLTLQDDVVVAPNFWRALRAMLRAAVPEQVVALSAVSPEGPEIARQGHRFYVTNSHLVGWAYLLDRASLEAFVAWVDEHPEELAARNEDDLLNVWVSTSGRLTWSPVPTLADHDVSIASTYGNDSHSHRRATVTWHGYPAERLEDPVFWAHNGRPPIAMVPAVHVCSWCQKRPAIRTNNKGFKICKLCIAEITLGEMGVGLQQRPVGP